MKVVRLKTVIRKTDAEGPDVAPEPRKPCPMTPDVLRELDHTKTGDVLLETTDVQQVALRRVACLIPDQARILDALTLTGPERLSADRLLS
jgi:hypothetical protein